MGNKKGEYGPISTVVKWLIILVILAIILIAIGVLITKGEFWIDKFKSLFGFG